MSTPTKWLLLVSLYFSQGLPFGFFNQALPVLLREEGASLAVVGLSGLLFVPWGFKWLWAPWVDGSKSRKAWIVPLQLATIFTALALSLVEGSPAEKLWWLKVAIVLCALFAATQDVPTDALAVNLLKPQERGLGNAVQVAGYRLGMVLGGGVLMIMLDRLGWSAAFLGMAAFLALTLLPVLLTREPVVTPAPRKANPIAGVWRRLKLPGMAALLLWLVAYKFGDAMASGMAKPYLVDAGWSKSDIGLWGGVLGSFGGLVGALLGGLAADRLGRYRALLFCGVGQTLAVGLYALHAVHLGDIALLKAAVVLEHVLGGMATVALFTLMMDASDPSHAGTDYTLQSCAVVATIGIGSIVAGVLGDALGFAALFVTATVLSGAGCALLLWALRAQRVPERLVRVMG